MRVLHFISDRNIGGAGILLLNLLRNMDRKKTQSAVVLPRGSLLRDRVLKIGVPVYETDAAIDRLTPAAVLAAGRFILRADPQIVHTNAAPAARIAGKLCGKKVIYTRHCRVADDPPATPWRTAERLFNGFFCDRAIATAEAAKEDLRRDGVPERKIVFIRNGCEEVRPVGAAELSVFRARYGILPSDFCVGICARLEPCKGHEVFLRAARMVMDALPEIPWKFLILGTGSRADILKEMARDIGLSDRVVFLGFHADTALFFRALRVHVNCSVGTETSCLAVSEGMSAGLPTVLSDFGGNRAMLGRSGAGYCVPADNAAAVAEALCRLAANPKLAAAMGARARRRYEQKYTAVGMAERLTAVYRELCP